MRIAFAITGALSGLVIFIMGFALASIPFLWIRDYGDYSILVFEKKRVIWMFLGVGGGVISLSIYLCISYLKMLWRSSFPTKRLLWIGAFSFGISAALSIWNAIGELLKEIQWSSNPDAISSLLSTLMFSTSFLLHVYLIKKTAYQGGAHNFEGCALKAWDLRDKPGNSKLFHEN